MQALWPRCASLLAVFTAIAGMGAAQRVWQRHILVSLESAAAGVDAPGQADARRLREEMDRVREEMDRLPPASRAMVEDMLTSGSRETIVNPVIRSLATLETVASGLTFEERLVAGAKAFERAWARAVRGLVRLLCFAAAVLVALGLAAIALSHQKLLSAAARGAVGLPHAWFLCLAIANAALFSATGRNLWFSMPWPFLCVPGALLIAGLLLRLQEGRAPDEALPEFLLALAPPACSLAVVSLLGLAG